MRDSAVARTFVIWRGPWSVYSGKKGSVLVHRKGSIELNQYSNGPCTEGEEQMSSWSFCGTIMDEGGMGSAKQELYT